MAEQKDVIKSRERHMARLKEKYPDREYEDDEALFAQIGDDYDDYDKQLEEYRGREKSLTNLFSSNPRSAAFLTDWRNGEDPIVGMIRKYGDDFKAALEDPERQEELAAANKEYAERIAKEKEYEEAYQTNLQESLALIESMKETDGITDADVDDAIGFLIGIMKDAIIGKFTRESLLMALKALRHDNDVEQAEIEGEVRGRNAKIEEKLRKGSRGDGTANLAGKNGGSGSPRQQPDLGAIDRGYGAKSICERGGEKRRPVK